MKRWLIPLFCAFSTLAIAQKPACDCKTKQGVYSVSVDGKLTYKGKNTANKFVYDLTMTFTSQVPCKVVIPDIQFNAIDMVLEPKLTLLADAKNSKKTYRKQFVSDKKLQPVTGLDDALFADVIVGYYLGEKACDYTETIGYTEHIRK